MAVRYTPDGAAIDFVMPVDANGNPIPNGPGSGTPNGYQQIVAATLAVATALTVPEGTRFAVIQPENGGVRWRDDGTDPTGTLGVPLNNGVQMVYSSGGLSAIKFIEATGSSAILNISYYQ